MDTRVPPLRFKILLASNPLKIPYGHERALAWSCRASEPQTAARSAERPCAYDSIVWLNCNDQ